MSLQRKNKKNELNIVLPTTDPEICSYRGRWPICFKDEATGGDVDQPRTFGSIRKARSERQK